MSTNDDSVTSKFRALRERAGLSMDDLAKTMGYARASSIQRYEDPAIYTKQYLSPEIVMKMIKAIAGKGDPKITPAEIWTLARPEVTATSLIGSYDPDKPDMEYENVYSREHWRPKTPGALPELDMKLGAGDGAVGEVINLPVGDGAISGHKVVAEWLIPIEYLRTEAKVSPKSAIIQEIKGDSMVPTYMPGDRVIIDVAQNEMTSDTVYAISYEGVSEPQIKRLQRVPLTRPPQVVIISDNPNLKDFTVELSQVHILGRICGHVARR